jgi:hypothetical protein
MAILSGMIMNERVMDRNLASNNLPLPLLHEYVKHKNREINWK